MRYGISACALENWPVLDISAGEFDAIKRAQRGLLTVLTIEEKFDAVLENYAEYERELLSLTLQRMVHQGECLPGD